MIERQDCQKCGNPQVVAHHYLGYAEENWLNVMWLCEFHHKEHHRLNPQISLTL